MTLVFTWQPTGMRPRDAARRDRTVRLSLLTCLLLASSLAAVALHPARANAHDLLADADPANDWIQGLANGESVPCCGTNDCYRLRPGELQLSSDGNFRVRIGTEDFPVLEHELLRDRSPDGHAWACPRWQPEAGGFMRRVMGVRCLLLPLMM